MLHRSVMLSEFDPHCGRAQLRLVDPGKRFDFNNQEGHLGRKGKIAYILRLPYPAMVAAESIALIRNSLSSLSHRGLCFESHFVTGWVGVHFVSLS